MLGEGDQVGSYAASSDCSS